MLAVVERAAPGKQDKPSGIVRGQAARLPWAWNGLCFGAPMHETSQEGLRDVVNNVALSAVGTVAWGRDNRGNTCVSLTDLGYVDYPDHPRHDQPSTELTAYIRFQRSTLAGQTEGGYFVNKYDTAAPWVTWGIQGDAAVTGKAEAYIAVGGVSTLFGDSAVIPTTEYVSAFLRWRSGEVPRLDVLGERGNTLSTVSGGGTLTGALSYNAGQGIRVNVNEGGTYMAANYSQAMVWSRRLNDNELAWLVADPFGWYSPRRESVVLASPIPIVALPSSGSRQPGQPLRRAGHL